MIGPEPSRAQRIAGCLFGMAFGDSLGSRTEFLSIELIKKHFPPQGPQQLEGAPHRVTDDTQMALAVGEALVEAMPGPWNASRLEPLFRKHFVQWLHSPDNNRAPGNTCMRGCLYLSQDKPWPEATSPTSKGCGANMRVAPISLLDSNTNAEGTEFPVHHAGLAQFQAALTHAHPTAIVAADITVFALRELFRGTEPSALPQLVKAYAESQQAVYHEDWFGDYWQQREYPSPKSFISRGWDECLEVIDRLIAATNAPDPSSDPCLATGAGWVAEEAFTTGLHCFLLFPNQPIEAIRRAAATSGDSDTIACLTGAFAGIYCGIDAWPQDWVANIEYHDRLTALSETLATN